MRAKLWLDGLLLVKVLHKHCLTSFRIMNSVLQHRIRAGVLLKGLVVPFFVDLVKFTI